MRRSHGRSLAATMMDCHECSVPELDRFIRSVLMESFGLMFCVSFVSWPGHAQFLSLSQEAEHRLLLSPGVASRCHFPVNIVLAAQFSVCVCVCPSRTVGSQIDFVLPTMKQRVFTRCPSGSVLVSVDGWAGTPVVGLTVVGVLVKASGCRRIGAKEREVKGEGPKILGGREASGRVMQGGVGDWPGSTHSWGFATPQSVRSWLRPRLMAAP